MTLLQMHLVAASAWLGLVAAEAVIELTAKDRATRQFVAEAHKKIDLLFEGPLVAIVLLTGSVLLYRVWPDVSPLMLGKIALGLVAVVANIICIKWVVGRARAKDDDEFFGYARKISLSGYTIPLAVLALVIGLYGG